VLCITIQYCLCLSWLLFILYCLILNVHSDCWYINPVIPLSVWYYVWYLFWYVCIVGDTDTLLTVSMMLLIVTFVDTSFVRYCYHCYSCCFTVVLLSDGSDAIGGPAFITIPDAILPKYWYLSLVHLLMYIWYDRWFVLDDIPCCCSHLVWCGISPIFIHIDVDYFDVLLFMMMTAVISLTCYCYISVIVDSILDDDMPLLTIDC